MGEHDLMTELASWRGTASCQESALDAGLCMVRYAFVLASPKCVPPCVEAGVALIGPGFMLSCWFGSLTENSPCCRCHGRRFAHGKVA